MAVSLMKPDILTAVKDLLLCQCGKESKVSRHGGWQDQKLSPQHSRCTNTQNANTSTEVDKVERAQERGMNSMSSSRDMWPSLDGLGPPSSVSHHRDLSDDLSLVAEQVDDDDTGELEDKKDNGPDVINDEEGLLQTS